MPTWPLTRWGLSASPTGNSAPPRSEFCSAWVTSPPCSGRPSGSSRPTRGSSTSREWLRSSRWQAYWRSLWCATPSHFTGWRGSNALAEIQHRGSYGGSNPVYSVGLPRPCRVDALPVGHGPVSRGSGSSQLHLALAMDLARPARRCRSGDRRTRPLQPDEWPRIDHCKSALSLPLNRSMADRSNHRQLGLYRSRLGRQFLPFRPPCLR